MSEFFIGVISSLVATAIIALVFKFIVPNIIDKWLYKGVRVDGSWDILEQRNGKRTKAGQIELKQYGRIVNGNSIRSKTREGRRSERKFSYKGTIHGHQLTLIFEDDKGVGFDTGTYVFIVQNDCKTMVGMATFHGKSENKIVSEPRILQKVVA